MEGWEIKLKTECGMTPYQAIKSATVVNAKLFKMENSIGTIEVGKWADIIVVDGHPDEEAIILAEPNNVRLVMKRGDIFKNTIT
jgi:imidazolonepropionase-like amidohydrolase